MNILIGLVLGLIAGLIAAVAVYLSDAAQRVLENGNGQRRSEHYSDGGTNQRGNSRSKRPKSRPRICWLQARTQTDNEIRERRRELSVAGNQN